MLLGFADLSKFAEHCLNVSNGFIGLSRHFDTQLLFVLSNTQSLPAPKVNYF